MSQKSYLFILKTGIFLSLLSSLLVFTKLIFPYISSKQIYFNILIEILAVFWLAFIIKYPNWNPFSKAQGRPKRFLVTYGLIAYFFAILLSCFFSVDFNLSFWGDIERMLGFFHIFHFLIFYFIIITIFRSWKDWKKFFLASIFISTLVCLYGIFNQKYDSTIGNLAYVAAFYIFNIYFSLILFAKEKSKLKWFYIVPIGIMAYGFFKTSISGAIVGLGFSFLVLGILYVFLSKNKKIKISISFLLITFFILIAGFCVGRNSEFIQNQSWLKPLREISWKKNTFQTRLISWKAAWLNFGEDPILGVGYGNYALIFDKYFDSSFYNYSYHETYFDRAHNNIIEIVATTGILGLASYLFIFLAVYYYLIKGYKKKKIGLHDFILVSSLIIAYFVQNLAVFDSLVTYIAIMMTLGYVYWLSSDFKEDDKEENNLAMSDFLILGGIILLAFSFLPYGNQRVNKGLLFLFIIYVIAMLFVYWSQKNSNKNNKELIEKDSKELFVWIVGGIIALLIIWQYNVLPFKMMNKTIDSQIAFKQNDLWEAYQLQKEAMSYNTVLDRDSRVSYLKAIANISSATKAVHQYQNKAPEIFEYAVELAKKNVAYNPHDSLNQQFLSQAYLALASVYADNDEKFDYYTTKALKAIDKSIEASPGRATTYFSKAQLYALRGEEKQALETANYAISLNPNYAEGYCALSQIYSTFNKELEALEAMNKCIDLGGLRSANSVDFLDALANYYTQKKDSNRLLKVLMRYSKISPKNTQVWISLANLYQEVGNNEKAIQAAKKAAQLDPSLERVAEDFIREIEK